VQGVDSHRSLYTIDVVRSTARSRGNKWPAYRAGGFVVRHEKM